MLLTIDERGSKITRNGVLITICRHTGNKWQSETLFLTIFDLHPSIVLSFSIAAYQVWTMYNVIFGTYPIGDQQWVSLCICTLKAKT